MKCLLVTFPDLTTEEVESNNYDLKTHDYIPIIKNNIEYNFLLVSASGKEAICTGYKR